MNKKQIAIKTVTSLSFFRDFLYEAILPELMAVKEWDTGTKKLVYQKDMYDGDQKKWVIIVRKGWMMISSSSPSREF